MKLYNGFSIPELTEAAENGEISYDTWSRMGDQLFIERNSFGGLTHV